MKCGRKSPRYSGKLREGDCDSDSNTFVTPLSDLMPYDKKRETSVKLTRNKHLDSSLEFEGLELDDSKRTPRCDADLGLDSFWPDNHETLSEELSSLKDYPTPPKRKVDLDNIPTRFVDDYYSLSQYKNAREDDVSSDSEDKGAKSSSDDETCERKDVTDPSVEDSSSTCDCTECREAALENDSSCDCSECREEAAVLYAELKAKMEKKMDFPRKGIEIAPSSAPTTTLLVAGDFVKITDAPPGKP